MFLILITVFVIILFVYLNRTYSYWRLRNIFQHFVNTIKVFLGRMSYGDLWKIQYNEFKRQNHRFGSAYLFTSKFFLPIDPQLLKSIMQTDFEYFMNHLGYVNEETDPLTGQLFSLRDTKWKNLRSKLTPTFSASKIRMMFATLVNCSENLKIVLDGYCENNEVVNAKEVLACFSTDVIGSCAFGIDCNSLKNPKCDIRKYGKMVFEFDLKDMIRRLLYLFLPNVLLKFLQYRPMRQEVSDFFINMVKSTVEYRERNNVHRKDFMHLLLQLKNMDKVTDDEKITESNFGEVGLNINQVAAQAFSFFTGGYESSSTAMTFALYEIALHPEIQTKLRNEITEVLNKFQNQFTYDAIMELYYLEKVVFESLRKYPPATVINRVCNKDYKVPGSDLIIESGTGVIISVLGIHHDHEYYPNPTVFDPERFTEENKAARPNFTWLPFGEGPRMCIGLRFGLLQTKVGLATIIKNYEISLSDRTTTPLTFSRTSFVLAAKGGVWMNLKKISN